MHHIGLNEIETAQMGVAVPIAGPFDLLSAHLHTGHARAEMGRDILAGIAHPRAELKHVVLWPQASVSTYVVEQRRTAQVGENLSVV